MTFACPFVVISNDPIPQHTFAARPWSKVGADLSELGEHTLLVVTDYYSNFIELRILPDGITRVYAKLS